MTEQAVVEDTDTEAKPSVEADNAQDDLENALREFDEQEPEQPAEPVKSEAPNDDTAEIINYVRQQREQEARESSIKDLKAAANAIKDSVGEIPVNLPDEVFEGLLYQRAENNPAIMKAWMNRGKNPEGWNKVLKAVGKEFGDKLKQTPDAKATGDWNAVESSMHSASTSSQNEPSKDVAKMSDAEFAAYKMSLQGG